MRTIALLGCGWLGFPLAQQLVQAGFQVKGSTTSRNKIPKLTQAGIAGFLLELNAQSASGDWTGFLADAEVLVVAIPPQLRGANPENFVSKMQLLLENVRLSGCKKVLFISSTSVYPDQNQVAIELDTIGMESQLIAAENLFLLADYCQTTVIRFGGLIGPDRHPARFLAGRTQLENPEAPVNLIHQDDCLAILYNCIHLPFQNEVYNAVAPYHPSRVNYYQEKARALQLPLPEFDYSKPSVGKTVSSEKLITQLDYTFLKPRL
ncbi:MAG: SDR family oxidoreductase [Flavobacterium sp.]|nr:SDR family oxidoreductase [Flavobacterium sp.]